MVSGPEAGCQHWLGGSAETVTQKSTLVRKGNGDRIGGWTVNMEPGAGLQTPSQFDGEMQYLDTDLNLTEGPARALRFDGEIQEYLTEGPEVRPDLTYSPRLVFGCTACIAVRRDA